MKINSHSDWGIRILKYSFLFLFVIFTFRLFYIQVYSHNHYRKKALDQQTSKKIIESQRGEIFSNDGFILATNNVTYILVIDPSVQKNIPELIKVLSDKISFENDVEKGIFLDRGAGIDPKLKYFILKKNLTRDERDAILSLKLPGVYFEKETKRFYPEGGLASSILGFVASSKEETQKGYYGIEAVMISYLREGLVV